MSWMTEFLRRLAGLAPRPASEEQQAEDRWLRINAAKRLAGCRCGRPATHVVRIGGNFGRVPIEIWSCEEHQNVNQWNRLGDAGAWKPAGDYGPVEQEWVVP